MALAQASSDAASEASEPASAIDDIVVTARKQSERLQSVPVSVVALTAVELEQRSLQSLSAVGQVIPNLTFSQTGNGGNTSALIYIRGVGQYDQLASFDPAVGVYVDGVYYARMQNNDFDLTNIERIEVLRGPQGTLFGKNTNGGAINIVTRSPDLSAPRVTGLVRGILGSRNRFELATQVDVPIATDRLALQVQGNIQKQDGYGHTLAGQDTGDRNRYSVRATLVGALTDTLKATIRGDYSHFDQNNAVFKLLQVNGSGPLLGPFNAYQMATGGLQYDNRWLTSGDFTSNATGPSKGRGSYGGASLTLDLDTSFGNVKSITAYRKTRLISDFDVDQSPVTELDYYTGVQHDQFSQEVQVSGDSIDRLKWIAGLYYFFEHAESQEGTDLADLNTAFSSIFGVPFSANFCECLGVKNRSYATFGQTTYSATDKLGITVGVRYNIDNKRVRRDHFDFDPIVGIGAPLQPTVVGEATFRSFTGRLGLDYQWSPDVMTYVSAAQGYKGGGFNGRAATVAEFNEYAPERVTTYEAGLRSEWLDRRFRFNATAFYSNYQDLQVTTTLSRLNAGVPVVLTVVENVPHAKISGFEIEAVLVPVQGLQLIANSGYTDARYTSLTPVSSVTTATRFPNTPRFTYNLAVDYGFNLKRIKLRARVDYTHKSAIDTDLLNDPYLRQKSYGLLDARLTASFVNGVQVAVFGTNITDRHYFTGGASNINGALGWDIANMAPPREWGVSATVRF